MSEPFLSEIRMMSFNYPPKGWALCNGQFLPINQNQALFALLGTTYGGNGQTTFALPDLRGRTPIHQSSNFSLGQRGGEEAHTITMSEMPQHLHFAQTVSAQANTDTPDTSLMLATASMDYYHSPVNLATMEPGMVSSVGGSQPHTNMMPYTVINFCIALQGIFPSRN